MIAQKYCYLIAPAKARSKTLRDVIRELGVRIDSIVEIPSAGIAVPSQVATRLRKADFACAIIPMGGSNSVSFEIGIAAGMNKPIFLIAEDVDAIPFGLQSFPHLVSALQDKDALRFHLSVFLKSLDGNTGRLPLKAHSPSLPKENSSLSARIAKDRVENVNISPFELQDLVSITLEEVGALVTADRTNVSGRPDFIAWFQNSPEDLGAPIIIEVKHTDNRPNALTQLERYMSLNNIRTAILITTHHADHIDITMTSSGFIFIMPLSYFLELAGSGRLLKSLIETRNRFVHSD